MYKVFKRFCDIVISLLGLIILSPLMLITAIAVKLDSPGPVLFKQKRLGRYGREFEMLKFRSMCVGAEHKGTGQYSFADDPRVTKVGKILRATSIDELPQFINILRGDMSLIGFRPPLTYHPWTFEEYTEEQKRMFAIRPGITGWAQVNGRKEVEWHERINLNIWYAENISFSLDFKIFIMTVVNIIKNKDNVNVGVTVAGQTDSAEDRTTEKV